MIETDKCLFCSKPQTLRHNTFDQEQWQSKLIMVLPNAIMLGPACFEDEDDRKEKIWFTVCPQCRGKYTITDVYHQIAKGRMKDFEEYIIDKSTDSSGVVRQSNSKDLTQEGSKP